MSASRFPKLPPPPYYVAIFSSQRSEVVVAPTSIAG